MRIIEFAFFTITSIVGLILNGTIVQAVVSIQRPYICTRISLHLAISNIFGCIFVVFLHGLGDDWLIQKNFCKPFLIFKTFWFASAILMTSFLVYESFLRFFRSLKDEESNNCFSLKYSLFIFWIVSIMIGVFTFLLTEITDRSLCVLYQHTKVELVQAYLVVAIMIPLLLLLIVYIYYKILVRRHRRTVGVTSSRQGERKKNTTQKFMHYMKSSFRVAQMIMLAWFPHAVYIFCLAEWFVYKIDSDEVTYQILKFLQWLCYSTCVTQPLAMLMLNYQIKNCVIRKWRSVFKSKSEGTESNEKFVSINTYLTEISRESFQFANKSIENLNKDTTPTTTPTIAQSSVSNTNLVGASFSNFTPLRESSFSAAPIGASVCNVATPIEYSFSNATLPIGGSASSDTPIEASSCITTPIGASIYNAATPVDASFSKDTPPIGRSRSNGTPFGTSSCNVATPNEAPFANSTIPNRGSNCIATPVGASFCNIATPNEASFSIADTPTGGPAFKATPIAEPSSDVTAPVKASFANAATPNGSSSCKETPIRESPSVVYTPIAHNVKSRDILQALMFGKKSQKISPENHAYENAKNNFENENTDSEDESDMADNMVEISERQSKYVVSEESTTVSYFDRPSVDVLKMFQNLEAMDREDSSRNTPY